MRDDNIVPHLVITRNTTDDISSPLLSAEQFIFLDENVADSRLHRGMRFNKKAF